MLMCLNDVTRLVMCCGLYVTLTLQHVYLNEYKRLNMFENCDQKVFILMLKKQHFFLECVLLAEYGTIEIDIKLSPHLCFHLLMTSLLSIYVYNQ